MNLRGQILLGSVALAVLPLILVILTIRSGIQDRFTELDTARVDNQIRIVRDDLARQNRELATLLDKLAETIVDDNDFRLGTIGGREDKRGYVLDFAPRQMSVMDLDMLLIQDDKGRPSAAATFATPTASSIRTCPPYWGVPAATAPWWPPAPRKKPFSPWRAPVPITLGERTFHLTGGDRLDQERLSSLNRDGDLALALVWPAGIVRHHRGPGRAPDRRTPGSGNRVSAAPLRDHRQVRAFSAHHRGQAG